MDVDRQSFIIYKNFYEPIKHLNNTDLGKLFRAIFEYNLSVPGTEKVNGYVVPPEVKIPFEFFKNQFNLDDAKWMKRVEASRENGLKGGRPPEPKEPTGLSGLETEPRKGDTVTDTVTGTGTETENETEKDFKEIQKKDEIKKHLLDSLHLVIPEWLDTKVWYDYLEHRKTNKKKMTTRAMELMIKKLDRARSDGHNPNNILEESICSGWQGIVIPDKPKFTPKQSVESDRSAPIEISFKNQRDVVRRNLAQMNKQEAQVEWENLPESWRQDLKIQQMFAEKN